ncbi:MAG TPA: hypothetical protein VFH41_09425 [Bradyrhizobium sp.]|nr:hypothetical protein [Bradyrhizobium sp.]
MTQTPVEARSIEAVRLANLRARVAATSRENSECIEISRMLLI